MYGCQSAYRILASSCYTKVSCIVIAGFSPRDFSSVLLRRGLFRVVFKLPFNPRHTSLCPIWGDSGIFPYPRGTESPFLISMLKGEEGPQLDQLMVQTRRVPATLHNLLVLHSICQHVGGLLASAIANMEGVHSYSSQRWLFILKG